MHCLRVPHLTAWLSLIILASTAQAESPAVLYEASISGYYIPHASDIVVDAGGNAYMIGSAYEDQHSLDVFIAKFDPDGTLLWSRYIVSSSHNYATGLALDAEKNLWVTGWTDSHDFPLVNPIRSTFQAREVFLMKLDHDSGATLYSTFIGGDYADTAEGMVIAPTGEIYLTGETGSTDFPVTADAYQPGPNFPLYFFSDAYITKLNSTGDEILYSTYFGGQEDDQAQQIGLDSAGNIIICGTTAAADFPLVNPLQSAQNELFVSKLSADGSTLLYSTYFGGADYDRFGGMVVDGAGNAYLTGSTRSVDFPTTPGAYDETFVGAIGGCEVPFGGHYNCEDIFVTKLATDGSGLVWSTYLGGTRVEEARGIAFDQMGRVYVTGYTGSPDFPPDGTTFGAEILLCRFDATGSDLELSYMVDSGSANRGNGVAIDVNGDPYFTGTVGVPASIYVSKLGGEMSAATTGVQIGVAQDVTSLQLSSGRPNPFRPSTRFEYAVPTTASAARLRIYDVAGHLVRDLVNAPASDGTYAVTWEGRDNRGNDVPSGVYFARLEAGGKARTQKVVKLNR